MKQRAESTTRRSFFWQAGAALSAPLAVATAGAAGRSDADGNAAQARLARREDVDAILELHRAYARLVNAGAHAEAAKLFADPATARIDESVRELSADRFAEHDAIEIAADGQAATARIHCVVRIETPIESSSTLAQMARLQGEGVVKRTEPRVLESACVKRGAVWKLERAVCRSV